MPDKKYKLVIIGAGIVGLSTALAWKKVFPSNESDILIVERNTNLGGCVTTFSRDGYRFDITQIIPDVSDLLSYFGVEVCQKKFIDYYARLFIANPKNWTTKIISIPSSNDRFLEMLMENYPKDKNSIKAFYSYCISMSDELKHLKTEPKWHQIPGLLFKCPKIIANSNKTYSQLIDRFGIKNQEVFQILDTFSLLSGLPADRSAATLNALAMVSALRGSFRPLKGFIQFPLAFKSKLLDYGVEIRNKAEVKRIITEKDAVIAVELSNGEVIDTEIVVSIADTKVTFERFIGNEKLKEVDYKYWRKMMVSKMSPSAISIHLGLDDGLDLENLGFNCGYNLLTSGPDAYSKMFNAWEKGELLQSDDDFHMVVISPSLLTGGKPNLIIQVNPVFAKYWIKLRENNYEKYTIEKMRISDFYISKVEEYMIPGLRKHITFIDVSTPATFKRYLGSPSGSNYDMLPVPSNFGKNRLATRTPIKGLFVPKFSHGIWPSMQAGLQVVDMITGGKIMGGSSCLEVKKNGKNGG